MPNPGSPYAKFKAKDLILRDVLARDRTVLANERTLLAYFRTSLMLAASGVTLIKFFPEQLVMVGFGYLLVVMVFPLFGLGFWRYLRVRQDMKRVLRDG